MRGQAMMGLSGTLVDQDQGVPTLADMATGLSRIPRFGGQTLVPWNVAHHLVVSMFLAADITSSETEETILFMALHDAHESMTMDVPTAFKTPDVKALQAKLDSRIYKAFGLTGPETVIEKQHIHQIDLRCLVNEAKVVTPFATYAWIAEYAGFDADPTGEALVRYVLARWPSSEEIRSLYMAWTSDLINRHAIQG